MRVKLTPHRLASAKHDGMMRKTTRQRQAEVKPGKPALTLVSCSSQGPDPRLVELVRILARRAARTWYAQQVISLVQLGGLEPPTS